jgi:hypothetical protein
MSGRMRPGTLVISPAEDSALRDAVGATGSSSTPHPAWAVVGTFRGLGDGVEGLFQMVGARLDEGVMFGECSIEVVRPLEMHRDYAVTCEVVGSTPRVGRTIGTFDLVEYVTEIWDAGDVAVRCVNSLIVPRHDDESSAL